MRKPVYVDNDILLSLRALAIRLQQAGLNEKPHELADKAIKRFVASQEHKLNKKLSPLTESASG